MAKLINSNDALFLSIRNIIKKLDTGIRTNSELGFTSFEMAIPTNTVLTIQGQLNHEGYIVETTTLPRGLTKLAITWG